mmetsp:Transcript_108/g.307  ORF Transcript_108/g.307 Transcript_108/m.307 type:complete len:84 (+) Transcript_108:52-303(+)
MDPKRHCTDSRYATSAGVDKLHLMPQTLPPTIAAVAARSINVLDTAGKGGGVDASVVLFVSVALAPANVGAGTGTGMGMSVVV